jgi:4-amino-4-deoxy-L-arabinose transferase-like glycosyltransferase
VALPFWIVGALAAPLTYLIGRDAGFARAPVLAASLMVAVPGGLTPFMSQPDNFGLFMTLGALSLWLSAKAWRGDRRALVLGGLTVGLATLARTDGVLLGIPLAVVVLRDLWRPTPGRLITVGAAVAGAAVFALIVGPWLLRQIDAFGSVAPSAASGRILWSTDYAQFHSISGEVGPESFFAQGLGAVLASRVGGLLSALGLFAYLPLAVVLTPFALIGAWVRRGDPVFKPFYVYACALFAASGVLFAIHVPHGTFIHSAVALVPHSFLLVVAGIAATVAWAARLRRTWDVPTATGAFAYGAVVVLIVAAGVQTLATLRHWHSVRGAQVELVAALRGTSPSDVVMAADPGAINYLTGHHAVVTPNDPLHVVEAAMRAYDVRWLVLESEQIVPSLEPVLIGQSQPSWLSSAVAIVRPVDRSALASTQPVAATEVPVAALFAVCLDPEDNRCAR